MKTVKHYKVGINDLQIPVSTGIRNHEKKTPQPVIFDVEMSIAYEKEAKLDKNVPSYSTVRKAIVEKAKEIHVSLLEDLIEKIGKMCLDQPGVIHVKIRGHKPKALPDAETWIEMEMGNLEV